jgi:hypothetical protein
MHLKFQAKFNSVQKKEFFWRRPSFVDIAGDFVLYNANKFALKKRRRGPLKSVELEL